MDWDKEVATSIANLALRMARSSGTTLTLGVSAGTGGSGGDSFRKPIGGGSLSSYLDTFLPVGSSAVWPRDPPTGLVKPKRRSGSKRIRMGWPLRIGRCTDRAPAHS